MRVLVCLFLNISIATSWSQEVKGAIRLEASTQRKGDAKKSYKVGTDPVHAKSYSRYNAFLEWYRESWFATTEPTASLVATDGYVAPPLDGVWATAPYLHNGSVPTLHDLLKSDERPERWQRSFGTGIRDFDETRVGWKVKRNPAGTDRRIYDTRKPGYGNDGHTFGDSLSAGARANLIEYLKTL